MRVSKRMLCPDLTYENLRPGRSSQDSRVRSGQTWLVIWRGKYQTLVERVDIAASKYPIDQTLGPVVHACSFAFARGEPG